VTRATNVIKKNHQWPEQQML